MPALPFSILLVSAYLLGAIPFGLLIGLALGKDIRQHGSRNIGATNAGRVLGRRWGFACLALDMLKGFGPAFAASFWVDAPTPPALAQWLAVALFAVLGHVFPVYLGFRGGKGVATTIGVALGVYPYLTVPMLAALTAYGVVRKLTGFVSAGSLALAVAFPLAFALFVTANPRMTMNRLWPLQAVSAALGLIIIVRHAGNIRRLLRGEEKRVTETGDP